MKTSMRSLGCLLLLLCCGLSGFLKAQVAGMNTLPVLQMSSSARTAALGITYLPLYDANDIQVAFDNPSLLQPQYHNRMALNYVGLFSESKFASVAYARNFKRFGTVLMGLQYNGYGQFDAYDENETPQGSFSASDIALAVAWTMHVDSNFSVGAAIRPVCSQYESYTAWALGLNVAGSFVSDNKRFVATIQARNIGAQLATFDGTVEHLPFDISAALSYKVSNAPFRLFFQMDQLTRWRLNYDDPLQPERTVDPYTGEPISKPWYDGLGNVLDQLARHAALGVEVDIKEHFFVRLGYRYRQAAEMDADDRTNINVSGFSYGFGLRVKRFEFSFARRNYHLGQAPNYISLSLKI